MPYREPGHYWDVEQTAKGFVAIERDSVSAKSYRKLGPVRTRRKAIGMLARLFKQEAKDAENQKRNRERQMECR